mgnify:CR=1 FL=1
MFINQIIILVFVIKIILKLTAMPQGGLREGIFEPPLEPVPHSGRAGGEKVSRNSGQHPGNKLVLY